MGFYIETEDATGKAEWIIKHMDGVRLAKPVYNDPADGFITVCVVDNGPFEAAGIAYRPREFEAFTDLRDTRHKEYLRVPADKVYANCPYVKQAIQETSIFRH